MRRALSLTTLLSAALILPAWSPGAGSASEGQDRATYIGSRACGTCHQDNHRLWSQSLHSRMIQPAGSAAILGDFEKNNTLEHEGWRFRMIRSGASYAIHEWDPAGSKTVYPVTWTLGSKRIQHYLSLRPDGRIRVTFPTWDVKRKRWFHSSEIIPTGDHAEVPIQIWNQHCYNCHVSQQVQGFDIESNTYSTSFTETGINCEMCHGPGSVHARRLKANPQERDRAIIHPGKLPAERQMMVCVQCHTPRIIVQHGYHPARNYYDHYMPTLMQFFINRQYDPPMWADGRMRRFATEGAALWQSRCYLEGKATCISCHNPHLNNVDRDENFQGDTNGLCTQCHESLKRPERLAAHTHHPPASAASQCIECHMPREVNIMVERERDHTISIPVPENTLRYQIPNACNGCHEDRSAQWSVDRMDRWYPGRPRVNARRADVFIQARERDPASVPRLIDLLRDPTQNRVIRGSAAGFLGEFQGEEVARALIQALGDSDVIVRAEATRSLSEVQHPEAAGPLEALLVDPNRIVRLNAFFALIKMGVLELEDSPHFERVRKEFETFLNDFPDVYDIRVNLGTYHAVQGNYMLALQEYRNAARVQPQLPLAYYFIGVTGAQLGLYETALEGFRRALELQPGFRNAEQLMREVEKAMQERRN